MIHQCQCSNCQKAERHPDQLSHQQLNLVMSRLDEQQRRWLAAMEATKLGHGGISQLSLITGLDEKTIARGQQELAQSLEGRPVAGVRLPGGGRKLTEKKKVKSRR
jgi:hypothetical protein